MKIIESSTYKESIRRIFSPNQEKDIIKRYQKGESSRELASRYNVDPNTILAYLKRNNIKIRDRNVLSPEQVRDIIKRYKDGELIPEIAKDYEVSIRTIYSYLKRNNIKIRDRNILSPEQVRDIIKRYKNEESVTEIAKDYKVSTSMGMYMESISKRIGQLALEQIKQKEFATFVSVDVNPQDAIKETQIPENIKTNLLQAFKSLTVVTINLYASYFVTKDIQVKGAHIKFKGLNNIIQVDLDFNKDTVKDFKPILQNIYKAICHVIRHELEHYVQNERINPRDKNQSNKAGHDYKGYIPVTKDPFRYFMNKEEIEAHSSDLYMRAKGNRNTFEKELRNFIEKTVYKMLYYEYYDGNVLGYAPGVLEDFATTKARKEAEQVYNTYLTYAKNKYPILRQPAKI